VFSKFFFAVAFFSVITLSHSHPHLFIKSGIEFVENETSVTGIRVQWSWDSYWSADVIAGCDTDRNGVLSDKEVKAVFTDFFDGIKEFNYFMELHVNGKKTPIKSITNFHAQIESDKTVTYFFTIPFTTGNIPLNTLKVGFNDDTIYVAFDKNLKVSNGTLYGFSDMTIGTFGYYGFSASFNINKM